MTFSPSFMRFHHAKKGHHGAPVECLSSFAKMSECTHHVTTLHRWMEKHPIPVAFEQSRSGNLTKFYKLADLRKWYAECKQRAANNK